ncbi:unnamed protein product [Paramecium sonneborni]|uniref:Uncharacterized protein n=1 Tax=Paramecium sonneborni TaxID=65129 RepID=A0A8S1RKR7_9CILI|nr:unnamed protein product [Paramecium sonneborni]CAD8127649.1 unnamed protein product [Paramecium sonneborni]
MNTIRKIRPSIGSSQEIQINASCSFTPKLTKSQTFIQIKNKCASSGSKNSTSTKLTSPYQPHQKSQFSLQTHSETQDIHSILNECLQIFKEIQQNSFNNEVVLLDGKDKMRNIEKIIEEILHHQNTKNSNQNKISQFMQQIIEEKRQKQQAIQSGENLIKQQANQIQQLNLRISIYQQ